MLATASDSTPFHPTSPEEKEAVRTQMEKLLQSSHFRHSRRYPTLLRHIVEETLEGRGSQLKERTLGVEVFGRAPDYDTASDPIVRVTVAEIRKRIAQYYHEDAHGTELRIELTPGTYLPEFFRNRDNSNRDSELQATVEEALPPAPGHPAVLQTPPSVPAPEPSKRRFWIAFSLIAALVLTVAACATWYVTRPSPIEELWAPVFAHGGPITYCMPMSAKRRAPGKAWTTPEAIEHALDIVDPQLPVGNTFYDHQLLGENVVYSDVSAIVKLESVIEQEHRPVRVRLNMGTNLNDLREGPAILLGGLSNQWTLEAIAPLRYRFSGSDDNGYYILDSKAPGNQQWQVHLKDKMTTVNRDYAIIGRVHSDEIGQTVMIAAGIGMSGTAAAGEFLADPAQVKELKRRMGSAFRSHDFEAVLQTDVVNGIAGPAQIVALDIR